MNKNIIIKVVATCAFATVVGLGTCWARPAGGSPPPPRGGHRMPPPPPRHHVGVAPRHHHHHGGSLWGHGGRNFLPGFIGGVVGGALVSETRVVTTPPAVVTPAPVVVAPAPVVVPATPVYTTQNFWVEGRYVDQIQANGTTIRVWQPGHYEQRQVLIQ